MKRSCAPSQKKLITSFGDMRVHPAQEHPTFKDSLATQILEHAPPSPKPSEATLSPPGAPLKRRRTIAKKKAFTSKLEKCPFILTQADESGNDGTSSDDSPSEESSRTSLVTSSSDTSELSTGSDVITSHETLQEIWNRSKTTGLKGKPVVVNLALSETLAELEESASILRKQVNGGTDMTASQWCLLKSLVHHIGIYWQPTSKSGQTIINLDASTKEDLLLADQGK